MGREIRRVPLDWEHPLDTKGNDKPAGHHHPLHDKDYATAVAEWKQAFADWEADKDGERSRVAAEYGPREYWEWSGDPPDRDYYRERAWTPEEAIAYQVYETVSEGAPVSPVFATLGKLRRWLIDEQSMSEAGADQFIEWGSVPSGIVNTATGVSKWGLAVAEPD